MSNRLLTVPQLAARWGWKPEKLRRLVQARRIPYVQDGARGEIWFRESAVEQWLTERTQQPRARVAAPVPDQPDTPPASLEQTEECRLLGIPVDHEFIR